MDPAIAGSPTFEGHAFTDGLGDRHHLVGPADESLEVLTLRAELTAVSSFDFALRERVSRLSQFHSTAFARVHAVERPDIGPGRLAIVSDRVEGIRLSEILAVAEKRRRRLEINAALCLVRQLVSAVATLHEALPDVAHGALAPERVIVPPSGRPVIVEHVLGAALEQLRFSVERYWKELRIALPKTGGLPRFDRRADMSSLGALTVALILGRPLRDNEYPALIGDIAGGLWAVSATGALEPLPTAIRVWLSRALQLDPRSSFQSAVEARAELESILGDRDRSAEQEALETFLKQAPPPPVVPKRASTAMPAAPARQEPHFDAPTLEQALIPAMKFDPEGQKPKASRLLPSLPGKRLIGAAAAILAVASMGTLAGRYLMPSAVVASTGTLVVKSDPPGVTVMIDGTKRGATPLTATLAPGDHVLELVTDVTKRMIPLTIAAGSQVSQYVELPKAAAAVGDLHVRTEPGGAKVSVDGQPHGPSPVRVTGLGAGPHTVTLESDLGTVTQEVIVEAGATASLVVPLTAARNAPLSGWIAIAAPVDVQVYEHNRLIGSSRSERIMVSAGEHQLEIVNEALGYRASRTLNVSPGQVATVRLAWPKGSLALNAVPWADVFIDGERVGETPIGQIAVPIGPHEVVFRHPELGEKRTTVTVTLEGPAKLSVDLRKQ